MDWLTVASLLIALHNVDGEEILVNPTYITTLHPTKESMSKGPNSLITKGVNCVVGFSNTKFISVVEDCETIRKAMDTANEPP